MSTFERVKVDEYKVLAHELLELADLWNRAAWWRKGAIANVIARKVWHRSDQIQSALMYHRTGMAAINSQYRPATPIPGQQREGE